MHTLELSHTGTGKELGDLCTNPMNHWERVLPLIGGLIPQHIWPVESTGRAGSGGQRKPQTG